MLMPRNVLVVGVVFLSAIFLNEQLRKEKKHKVSDDTHAQVAVAVAVVDPEDLEMTDFVFFDVEQAKQPLGRIVMGLYGNQVPRTVKNFVELSKREGEVVPDRRLAPEELGNHGYKGSFFHRVIPKFMIQGGDFLNHDGTGSYSIYGAQFADENLAIPHFTGCLSMANRGKNSNGSQFFITTAPTPWLNKKHVVFGKVVQGFDVVKAIEAVETDQKFNRPIKPIRIVRCGSVPLEQIKKKQQ